MPEGPEVKRTSLDLDSRVRGKYLRAPELAEKGKKILKSPMPFPYGRIVKVVSYGKKVIFCLKWVNKDFYLVSSLGMEGRWRFEDKGLSHVRAEFTVSRRRGAFLIPESKLYYDDSRMFGSLVFTESLDFLNQLGPDILGSKVSEEEFMACFGPHRNKQVCQALLEQKAISGVGNYLKADILYEAKVRPDRLCSSLEVKEWAALREACYRLAAESFKHNGLTIKTYIAPGGALGTYKARVYGKNADPSGNEVVKETFKDQRGTYWVPAVQK